MTSLGETQMSCTASCHGWSSATPSRADSLHGKGHWPSASLGIGSIFGWGSCPGSPVHDEGHSESLQSNGGEQGREKSYSKCISLFPHNALGKKGEALQPKDEHKEIGGRSLEKVCQSFWKVPIVIPLNPKYKNIYFPYFFWDSVTYQHH